jgi:hypothetical protein
MQWLRWKPANYLQVWLLALGIGVIVILAYLASGGRAFGIWYAVSLFAVAGIAESIRLKRRRAVTRRPSQPPLS